MQPLRRRGATPIVYLRGAGWWAGTLDASARTMALASNASGLPVCGVDYHNAPEQQFPVQLDEVLACLRALPQLAPSLGVDARSVLLWGESAGATLAACAARELPPAGPRIDGLLLLYGNFAGPGPNSRPQSQWVWQQYLGNASAADRARAIVLCGDVATLPATWIGAGDADPLLADSLALADRLRQCGVPCETIVYPGMPHGFVTMSRFLTPARRAIDDAARAAQRFAGIGAVQQSMEVDR